MSARTLSTVLFDVGGTLLSTDPHEYVVFQEACAELGHSVETGDLPEAFRHAEIHTAAPLPRTESEERAYFTEYNQRVMEHLGIRITPEEGLHINRAFSVHWSLEAYDEVEEVLTALKDRGKRLAVVSNALPSARGLLRDLGLTPYFEDVILSSEVGSSKPDRRIFEVALARTRSRPEDTAHVGDTYEADIVGARSAGITPVLLDRDGRHDDPGCLVIRDLRGLLSMV